MSVKESDIKGILSMWIKTRADDSELKNIEKISELEL